MALKTAIRVLFKWLPKSPEMVQAYRLDVAADTGDPQGLEDLLQANAVVKDVPPKGDNGGGLASLGQSTIPSKPKPAPKREPEPASEPPLPSGEIPLTDEDMAASSSQAESDEKLFG